MTIAFANSFRPEYQANALILSLRPEGGAKPIQVSVQAEHVQPRSSSEFLVRLDLEPGRYELTRVMGVAGSGVTAPQLDVAVSMPFALAPGPLHYLGRVAIENVERTSEDDVPTGNSGVGPMQDKAGFSNGTPVITAFDALEQDVQRFKARWPELDTRAVKSALPPYVRTVSPRGSPVLLREAYFMPAEKPVRAQADATAGATPSASPPPTPAANATPMPAANATPTPAANATATPSANATATPAVTPPAIPTANPAATPAASPAATPAENPPAMPKAAPAQAPAPVSAAAHAADASKAPTATPVPASAPPVQSGQFVEPTPLSASAGAALPPEAAQLYQRFLRSTYPRALAISGSGAKGIAVGGHDVIQRAMAECERRKRSDGPRCRLYAVDDTVVDLPQTSVRAPEPPTASPQRVRSPSAGPAADR